MFVQEAYELYKNGFKFNPSTLFDYNVDGDINKITLAMYWIIITS